MTKLELKSSHEVIDTVDAAEIESIFQGKPTDPDILTVLMKDGKRLYCDEVCPVDSLQEEKDLNVNSLTWEDIKEIYFLFKTVKNEWYGHEFSDYGICQEVLKRFKEQKGEEV